MIKDNQKYFNRLHLLVDAGIVAISYLLAWYIKFGTVFADTEPGVGALDTRIYFSYLYFVVPEYIILYYFFNMYAPKRATRRKYELIGGRHYKGQLCGNRALYCVPVYDSSASFFPFYDGCFFCSKYYPDNHLPYPDTEHASLFSQKRIQS